MGDQATFSNSNEEAFAKGKGKADPTQDMNMDSESDSESENEIVGLRSFTDINLCFVLTLLRVSRLTMVCTLTLDYLPTTLVGTSICAM